MDTAMFFRDVNNYNKLEELTGLNTGIIHPYRIINRVQLDNIEYEKFCSDFMRGYSFLNAFVDSSKVTEDIWNCILVEHESAVSVLVMTNGYQYPRFVAIFNDK